MGRRRRQRRAPSSPTATAFGDREGRRRCVLGLNIATDDALATGDTLLELTRTVFCGR